MAVVAVAGWVATIWLTTGSMALNDMGVPMGLGMGGQPGLTGAAIFLGMWLLMMAAMMFPSVWPVAVRYVNAHREAHVRPSPALFLAGYLLIWEGFGVLTYVLYVAVGLLVLATPMLGDRLPLIAGAIVAAAGLYQLTPMKRECLEHCRHAGSVLAGPIWAGEGDTPWGEVRQGLGHGIDCLGCCGGLMVGLVALGAMDLRWMLLAALAIAVEKLGPPGRLVPSVIGVGMIALGVVGALGMLGGAGGMGGM
jgi:predicted metal-binding membrane protein